MNTKDVVILVFDSKENFKKTKDIIADERAVKSLRCISNRKTFETELKKLDDSDFICVIVHVFYTNSIRGIKKFLASGIKKNYPLINEMYVSEGSSKEIRYQMVQEEIPDKEVFKYHQILRSIEDDKIKLFTKKEIIENSAAHKSVTTDKVNPNLSVKDSYKIYPQVDYALITALYKDEFEQVKKVFNFPKKEIIKTEKIHYYIGYLKVNPTKKIVASIPDETGMVDSAIIATQLLEFFRPKYLLMSGVCGGGSDLNFGDIVVASQVFTFQKGKLSDLLKKSNKKGKVRYQLYDKNKKGVDHAHLYDKEGNQVNIIIEKFEKELGSPIKLNSLVKGSIENNLAEINKAINNSLSKAEANKRKTVEIKIAPIACSTMIINKEGYFDNIIRSIDRKTAAVEMESYGVARACDFANDGKTKCIIFKAVMDKAKYKKDTYKKFAAQISAQFLKQLLIKEVI